MVGSNHSDQNNHMHDHAVPGAGENGKAHNTLGHSRSVGVEGTNGASYKGAGHNHGNAGDAVVSHSPCQRDADGNENYALRVKSDKAAQQGEQEHNDKYDEMLFSLQSLHQLVDHDVNRLRGIDDGEGSSRDHHEENQGRHLRQSCGDGIKKLIQRDGILGHPVEGSGDQNFPAGVVGGRVKLAGGDDIGQQRADYQNGKNEKIGVRHLHGKEAGEAFFLFL